MQAWQIAFQRKGLSCFKRNKIGFSRAQPVSVSGRPQDFTGELYPNWKKENLAFKSASLGKPCHSGDFMHSDRLPLCILEISPCRRNLTAYRGKRTTGCLEAEFYRETAFWGQSIILAEVSFLWIKVSSCQSLDKMQILFQFIRLLSFGAFNMNGSVTSLCKVIDSWYQALAKGRNATSPYCGIEPSLQVTLQPEGRTLLLAKQESLVLAPSLSSMPMKVSGSSGLSEPEKNLKK